MEAAEPVEIHLDLTRAPDEDLLAWMARRDNVESAATAEAAFEIFYERHRRFVYDACRWRWNGYLDQPGIADLVSDTFFRAYQKADTFRSSKSTDPDHRRGRVRAWLVRIARNLLYSSLRAQQGAVLVRL